MTRLHALWDSLRSTYWAVPSAMAIAAVALAFGVIQLDERIASKLLDRLSWVYTGGAEGARAVLSTIAASMITVAGVTFSITIVSLTLASQQFGPRLLRNFLRDLGNQIVLGTFVSTYIYCVLVLRTVRGSDGSAFVPHLAVTVGVVLAMLSLGVLIYFIHHVSVSIQASQIIANVAADLDGAIDRVFPERLGEEPVEGRTVPTEGASTDFGEASSAVASKGTGYVQAIDSERLMAVACRDGLVVRVDATPGAFVRPGVPLVSVLPALPPDHDDAALRSAFVIGTDRTGTQDLTFFVDQLVELAVRALSPGINDPATACACLDRLEAALCRLAGRQIPSPYRYDGDGTLRVIAQPVTFAGAAERAFEEIGRHGRGSVTVTCRLLDACRSLAACVHGGEDRRELVRLAETIADRALDALSHGADRTRVEDAQDAALEALRARQARSLDGAHHPNA